jgi:hypothetical protein
MKRNLLMAVACISAMGSSTLQAQTAQDWSLHASGFQTEFQVDGLSAVGRGAEVQLRRTFGLFSLAIGGQFTDHPSLEPGYQIGGLLLEPRYVIDIKSLRVFPYVLVRGAALQRLNSPDNERFTGIDAGVGGGVIVSLTRRVNFDAGAALTRTRWTNEVDGEASTSTWVQNYAVKAGLSIGLGK